MAATIVQICKCLDAPIITIVVNQMSITIFIVIVWIETLIMEILIANMEDAPRYVMHVVVGVTAKHQCIA